MEKKTIILPGLEYYKAPSVDLTTRVALETNEELLREGDRSIILDLEQQFSDERNEIPNYKIYGKIRMIFRNMYEGTAGYGNLQEYLALRGDGSNNIFTGYLPYDEFAFIRRDTYRQDINIPSVSGATYGTYTPSFSLPTNPRNKHQNISNMNAPYHNWNLYLSYVYSSDANYPMKYTLSGGTKVEGTNIKTFVSGDGIPCRVESKTGYYKLTSPVKHGINSTDFVIISGKTYSVSSLGDGKYDSENYVINLNKQQISGSTTLPGIVTIKRCIDDKNISGTTSSYYVHKHKIITKEKDYILDKAGFESSIFEDEKKLLFENSAGVNDFLVERNRGESLIYDFREPFVLSGLTNNLGYTPSEVYVTVIFRNGSGYFEYPPKVGYKFNLHNEWIDNHFSGSTSIETTIPSTGITGNTGVTGFTAGLSLPVGTILTGAFVEYNEVDLKERIISESLHKIVNPVTIFDHEQDQNVVEFNGATANNKMGLLYQPHYRVKLRQLSNYVETSNTNNILDLPDNAKYFPDQGLWRWRDVFDHGYIDEDGNGTDYPFVNGQHYIKTDINFYFLNEREYNNKSNGFKGFGNINC
jgi:hypothetical protein